MGRLQHIHTMFRDTVLIVLCLFVLLIIFSVTLGVMNGGGNVRVGLAELIVIAVFALIIIKPEKIPEYSKKFALVMKQLKNGKQEMDEVLQPAEEMQKELTRTVKDTVLTAAGDETSDENN